MKQVLIAHQSTVPHYRVPFYNALEELRPESWRFDVVFDQQEATLKRFFKEELTPSSFQFPSVDTKSYVLTVQRKQVVYQTFWPQGKHYDLIVVGSALNNLSYPLCRLHRLGKTKLAYWGHGANRDIVEPTGWRRLLEVLRVHWMNRADGFFAYTNGVANHIESSGVDSEKIFILNNTIDIEHQRTHYREWINQRQQIKKEMGLEGKKVLLFVGRFTPNKRIDFLLDAFSKVLERDRRCHLLLVGSGNEEFLAPYIGGMMNNITRFGPTTDLSILAPVYTISDLYVFPGAVGLGPLQALCYDLPILTIDSPRHMPEFEYLSAGNSLILDAGATPVRYAQAVIDLIGPYDSQLSSHLLKLRANAWPSIKHLTIQQMASNFINGVNTMLEINQ